MLTPDAVLYLPAFLPVAQFVQTVEAAAPEYAPAPQRAQTEAAAAKNLPGVQLMQAEAPVELFCVPASHSSQAVLIPAAALYCRVWTSTRHLVPGARTSNRARCANRLSPAARAGCANRLSPAASSATAAVATRCRSVEWSRVEAMHVI